MNFNKCERCGCFFTSNDIICPNCAPKDNLEMSRLKDYLAVNNSVNSIDDICLDTGISAKNINRYLVKSDFAGILNIHTKGNTSINL